MKIITTKLNRYQFDAGKPFTYGRISVLFRGTDKDGSPVCVKLFRDSVGDRSGQSVVREFLNELKAHKRIKHPNMLPILDFGRYKEDDDQHLFVITPFVEGGNLRRLMKSRDFVPLSEAMPILQQIASAIDMAHSQGVIHGDIKPENILFSGDRSHAYLCDFGMAKYFSIQVEIETGGYPRTRNAARRVSATARMYTPSSSTPMGSTAYLSPEQIDAGRQTPRSDIYSFSIVAYELLTGQLPFDIETGEYRQMKAKIEGKLIDPESVISLVLPCTRDALLHGLAVGEDERPSSASEFCQELSGNKTTPSVQPHKSMLGGLWGFWNSLSPSYKVGVVTAVITALTAIVTSLIAIIPPLLKR